MEKQVMKPEKAKTQEGEASAQEMENGEQAQVIRIRAPLVAHQWRKLGHMFSRLTMR